MTDISAPWRGSGRIAGLNRHSNVKHRPHPTSQRRKTDRAWCLQVGRLMIAFGGTDGWCSDGHGPERRDEGSRHG
jgi:hypothetical protein